MSAFYTNSQSVRFANENVHSDDVVDAAWNNNLGVHALIWFGFDGTDEWIGRRDTLYAALHANPKAKFVTRVLQFGSEPLFDNVLPHDQLAKQVMLAKQNLSSLHIPVTVSELAYGYQERGGAQDVLDAIDSINIHMLPFFSQQASTAKASWPLVQTDLNWFIQHGNGKKMYLDEVCPCCEVVGTEADRIPDRMAGLPSPLRVYSQTAQMLFQTFKTNRYVLCLSPRIALTNVGLLRTAGQALLRLQECPWRRCRMVRAYLLRQPGAGLWDLRLEGQDENSLRTEDTLLSVPDKVVSLYHICMGFIVCIIYLGEM